MPRGPTSHERIHQRKLAPGYLSNNRVSAQGPLDTAVAKQAHQMWGVDNRTAFAAERTWLRDRDGRHLWCVAVRATFTVSDDGAVTVADEQPAPALLPEYRADPASSSLARDADVGPPKPETDVLVRGSAHAGREPRREVPVGLRFGSIEKTVLARGTNVYYDGPLGRTTTRPDLFSIMPLTYERAYGGQDWRNEDLAKRAMDLRNPVGVGMPLPSGGPQAGPNVVYPGGRPAKDGPAGFGPIASHWSPRAELAGTFNADWIRHRKPLLPSDYDERFEQASPTDQRGGTLGPGACVEVVNMTPAGVFRVEIPRVEIRLTTYVGGGTVEYGASLATVDIALDEPPYVLTLVWRSGLVVARKKVAQLDETRVEER